MMHYFAEIQTSIPRKYKQSATLTGTEISHKIFLVK